MAYILVVDDEERMRHVLSIILERKGHRVDQAGDGLEALEKVRSTPFDMIITDIKMPGMDGTRLLEKVMEMDLPCPVVFITAFATVEQAVEAMRKGAVDYITKPFDEDRILLTVERTFNISRIMTENKELRQELKKAAGGEDIIYQSPSMTRVMELAAKVAKSDSAVLIHGESGTGKELLAAYIHDESPRGKNRFVPVNCAAISANLIESELFGHEKGSFTGAHRRVIGKFEYASGGTLFLDEIGDLSLDAQAKLLRALQEKKIQRVGGNDEIPVDVRIICATNRDLSGLVEAGGFRQDLLFRINVFPITPPPLRERRDDVPLLAGYFLSRLGGRPDVQLTGGAVRVLTEYQWPGNVRELANVVERAMILAGDHPIMAQTLSFLSRSQAAADREMDLPLPAEGVSLEKVVQDLARKALKASDNNQTAAARLLGLTRAKFRVLLRRLDDEI